MPINYDLIKQAHEKTNLKSAQLAAQAEREEQEQQAREVNYLIDYLAQLGIKADLYGYTLYAFIHADGFSFSLETQTSDAMRNRFFRIVRKATGDSETLLLPFYSLPDTWHPDHKHNFQARLHEAFSRLNAHNAMPSPASVNTEAQPLDLMPTTLIQDECEAAYDLIKQAHGIVGEALVFCGLNSYGDVKSVLNLLSAKLGYFLSESDDDEPNPEEESLITWAGDDDDPYDAGSLQSDGSGINEKPRAGGMSAGT